MIRDQLTASRFQNWNQFIKSQFLKESWLKNNSKLKAVYEVYFQNRSCLNKTDFKFENRFLKNEVIQVDLSYKWLQAYLKS